MKIIGFLLSLYLAAITPALAQQQQPTTSPLTEAMSTVYQMGMQMGAQLERMNAATEAQKATLIEWLKAAQAEKK